MKIIFKVVLYFLLVTTTFSQTKKSNTIYNQHVEYFKSQNENIYTHLNKSNVLINENLWLQSYIYYNKDAVPYTSTTLMFYNVYDQSGLLIDQKVFHAKDGFVSGQIKIDNKYKPGIYYLKSTTNWMRNFNIDKSDFKTFIVNSEPKNDEVLNATQLHIIPEGGQLISNTVNTIGVKINTNPNNYKKFQGVVKNQNGEIASFFSFNHFGLSKFNVFLNSKDNYTVFVYDGEIELLSKNISGINAQGVSISVKNAQDKFLVSLNTNSTTIKELSDKTYKLYYHRDGEINHVDIHFKEDILQYTIAFLKSDLLSGINILTLLNEKNTPIVERMIFNEFNLKLGQIEDDVRIHKQKDSLIISLKTNLKSGVSNNFSVSVLPEYTKSYNFSDNIITKLLLSPYLNSPISTSNGYLIDITNKSMYYLDLLLITEGHSKQSWNDIIYKPQIIKYPFDTGFQIKGKLNSANSRSAETIELISPLNGIAIKTDLTEDNFFEFTNLYLNKDTSINFVLRNKNDKTVRAYPYYNFFPKPIIDSINFTSIPFEIPKQEVVEITNLENFIMDDKTIELDEVDLKTIKKKNKPNNNPVGLNASDLVEITDKENNAQLVVDFIGQNGFDVSISGGTVSILSRRGRSLSGRFAPQVFLDHANITNTLELISTMRLNQVDEIFISRNGAGLGTNGAGGAISIFSRTGFGTGKKGEYKTFELTFGFDNKERFKSPFYQSNTTDIFDFYGVIDWKPLVKANENGIINIKIPNSNSNSVNLYINGMDQNGNLYHLIKEVSLK